MIEQIIKSAISYIVPAVIGYLVCQLVNNKKKNDSLKMGVMTLLQSNLSNAFFYYEPLGEWPDYICKNFLNELKSYENLGGDDYIHAIAEKVKSLDITRTDILDKKTIKK